ncbi:MAG TPA: hypothetical protein VNV35_04195 [Puia sp.]|jgi:hypothetical protein|nr:hypothetical protein [Puia sp.]
MLKHPIWRVIGRRLPVPALVGLVIFLGTFIPKFEPCTYDKNPSAGVAKSLDVSIEEDKFLLSIAFFVVGFFGAVIIGKATIPQTTLNRVLVLLTATLGICSAYFGYLRYETLNDLVRNNMWCLDSNRLEVLKGLQFYTLITGCLAFVVLAYELYLHPQNNET